jgi:hypothetical protein
MLATGVEPARSGSFPGRHVVTLGSGVLVSVLLMTSVLGVRPTLPGDVALPMFWVKAIFCAAVAGGALVTAARLARPGKAIGLAPAWPAASIVLMWMLASVALFEVNPDDRAALIFGNTSTVCPLLIALLSSPVFVAIIWAVKSLAPTRLRLAGAAAGLASGGIGALVYTFHCPELEAPFLAVWYMLGVLMPAAVGGLFGPSLLRW